MRGFGYCVRRLRFRKPVFLEVTGLKHPVQCSKSSSSSSISGDGSERVNGDARFSRPYSMALTWTGSTRDTARGRFDPKRKRERELPTSQQ